MTDANQAIASGRLSAELLQRNFQDLKPAFTQTDALVESDRCYFCYDAPCATACPTGIDIPLFIRQIATRDTLGSAKTILSANIMGGMCARVCPTEDLCEAVCVRNGDEASPLQIGRLQRFATDCAVDTDTQFFDRAPSTGRRVAIVGAGPAGLACAHGLAREGHSVTVYESRTKAGGLSEFGIAAYKTVDDFAAREVEYVLGVGGIEIKTNTAIGRDISVQQLSEQYDAVFLGFGLGANRALGITGDSLPGMHDAVDFIARLRQQQDKSLLEVGRNVVVIGGGMTAIDIAVQIKRLGAEQVSLVYRRGPEQMNASRYEQELALLNGVVVIHWASPTELIGSDLGVQSVRFDKMRIDRAGALAKTGEQLTLPADQVFSAIGQTLISDLLDGIKLDNSGAKIAVDDRRRTSRDRVWAGGDCIHLGEDLTVAAVEDGKIAAADIHQTLIDSRAD